MRSKKEVNRILKTLARLYPDAHCSLDHASPLELLVATILSAQCTDLRVNLVTKTLFDKYKTPEDYARTDIHDLENDVRSTGFFRNKAKSIKALGQTLMDEHNSQVPRTLKALVKLPGVGRKTANVVLGTAFDIPGMVVDTHVTRFSNRMDLTSHKDAVKIEFDLMEQLPKSKWVVFTHQVISHGRKICKARKPDCEACELAMLCPF